MQRKNLVLTILVAVGMAVPAASATWYAHGSYEPDTPWDVAQGYMWESPDTNGDPAVRQIYFNAVPNVWFSGQNPNQGQLGSRVWVTPVQTYGAYFGVWKDCNGDSTIGNADGAQMEYPTQLLLRQDICPDGSDFNKDGLVQEFLWIGPADTTWDQDYYMPDRIINDTQALVWGDWGRPGGGVAGSCPINPQPAGTFGSTGGLIYYADCILNNRITNTANSLDPNCDVNLCIDGERPQADEDSLLNQRFPIHPWYDPYAPPSERTGALEEYESHNGDPEHSKRPAFTVWDCSSPDATTVPDGQGGTLLGVPALASNPNPDADGSFYDAVNDTESGITTGPNHQGCAGNQTYVGGFVGEVSPEDNFGSTSAEKGKMDTDHYFRFNGWDRNIATCVYRNHAILGEVPPGCDDRDREVHEALDGAGVWNFGQDGGIGATRFTFYGSGPSWTSLPNWLTLPQGISRANLQPEPARYVTFYGQLGSVGLSAGNTPTNQEGTYGFEWCQGVSDGIVDGFDCNPDHWWNPAYDPDNTDMPTQNTNSDDTCWDAQNNVPNGRTNCRDVGARAGQPYHVRDTDCFDGEVARDSGVYASLVLLSNGGPCAREMPQ